MIFHADSFALAIRRWGGPPGIENAGLPDPSEEGGVRRFRPSAEGGCILPRRCGICQELSSTTLQVAEHRLGLDVCDVEFGEPV